MNPKPENKNNRIPRLPESPQITPRVEGTLPNYTLSTVCPSCGTETYRLACKVRCARCGFMWDCSEI